MKNNRRDIVYTALATILAFISVAYTSCREKGKEVGPDYCVNVVCKNGGYCMAGTCYCPAGYEGTSCEVKTTGKYEGTWEVIDTIIYSNITPTQTKAVYDVSITSSASDNRQFLIDNFMAGVNDILCQANRPDSFFFSENQVITNTNKTLVRGGGTINQFSTTFGGTYQVTYPASPEPVKQTHRITAIRK